MKTLSKLIITTLIPLSLTVNAEPSSHHASKASKHSALASGHGLASTAQVASGVVAVPLLAIGSVGVVASAAADELLDAASHKHHTHKHRPAKLEITEVTITVDRSPAEAMKKNKDQQ